MQSNQQYNEKTFSIDLIMDAYKTKDIDIIIEKAEKDLDLKVTFKEVYNHLYNKTEDLKKESWTLSSKEIF